MGRKKDLTNQKFGRLTVLKSEGNNKWGTPQWLCVCECGNRKTISSSNLLSSHTQSCKCLQKEKRFAGSIALNNNDRVGGIRMSLLKQKVRTNNTSGIKGVSYDKSRNKWVSYISVGGKNMKLGRYETLKEAIEKRKEAEEKYFKPVIEEYEKQKEGEVNVRT